MDTAGQQGKFSTGFLQGLAVVVFLYAVIFTTTIFLSGKTHDQLEARLASRVVEISREQGPVPQPNTTVPEPTPAGQHTETHDPVVPDTVPPVYSNTSAAAADLIETTPQGPLPKKSATGMTPFDAYKKPFTYEGKPVIAIVVSDYGLSETNSKEALKALPGEMSFILSPYAQNYDTWKSLATAEGHEFWLGVPIENQSYPNVGDPGPQALLAHSDFKYNQEKFIWALTRVTGYTGIAAFTDGSFINAQSALKALWDEAYNRGLAYFELNPIGLEGIEMNAVEQGAAFVRNTSIFNEGNQDINEWLSRLETEAGNSGTVIGVIKPYPQIVSAVAEWAKSVEGRGYSLAPVSSMAQTKVSASPAPVSPAPAAPASHAAP